MLKIALCLGPLLSPVVQEESTEGFANPQLLVTTGWLQENADSVAIVDVRAEEEYARGHLPGARNLPVSATYDPEARGMVGSPERIAKLLGDLGIAPETRVVLYDEGRSTNAPRVFWTLEVRGQENVSVLDGGFAKWKAERRDTDTETPELEPVEREPRASEAGLSTAERLLEDLESPDAVMVDARSAREYDSGRIPEAVRIEWVQNFTEDPVPVLRSPAELRALYRDQGVTPDKRVHAY